MSTQKIQRELKMLTKVTAIQFIGMFLFIGLLASIFASFILGMQDKLQGGIGIWGAFLSLCLLCFAGTVIGYLKFKQKAKNLSINPRNHRLKNTRPLFSGKQETAPVTGGKTTEGR
ncbi:MAG: hypothetical protein JST84_06195 [Acidobacteria bacterium]|nr:hypothetical protein [Acidobacteriota bacterium]